MANNTGLVQYKKKIKTPYFVGFSTVDKVLPPYALTDIELVKRDLLNHFSTPRGSRVMLPEFGTRIYEYLFDPFDEYTKNAIIGDASEVVASDPRVELVNIDVMQEDQTLIVGINLLFKPEGVADSLFVTFNLKDQATP